MAMSMLAWRRRMAKRVALVTGGMGGLGTAICRALHDAGFGVDVEGKRDVLGLYIGEHEGAQHWGRILEDIQKRGVVDVLFF